jgi:hypothetical protein
MGLRHLAHNRQAQAGSVRTASRERLEQKLADVYGNTFPGIRHRQPNPHTFDLGVQHDRRSVVRVLNGVEDEIVERAANRRRVKFDRLKIARDLQGNRPPPRLFAE